MRKAALLGFCCAGALFCTRLADAAPVNDSAPTAYDNATQVAQQVFPNVSANTSQGLVSHVKPAAQATVSSSSSTSWDFSVDSPSFNETGQEAVGDQSLPSTDNQSPSSSESVVYGPPAVWTAMPALALLGVVIAVRSRKQSTKA